MQLDEFKRREFITSMAEAAWPLGARAPVDRRLQA
jgi:hypothetical protein